MAGPSIHDTTLIKLEASDEGRALRLVLEALDKSRTQVEFSSVHAYSINQVGGAIITDIREESLEEFEACRGSILESLKFLGHVAMSGGTRVWVLESAIGFSGYVIGEAIETTSI